MSGQLKMGILFQLFLYNIHSRGNYERTRRVTVDYQEQLLLISALLKAKKILMKSVIFRYILIMHEDIKREGVIGEFYIRSSQ